VTDLVRDVDEKTHTHTYMVYGMVLVNGDRLWDSLMEMGEIGMGVRGVNRQALNDGDKDSRDVFTGWLREEGAELRIDSIGNIFGVRKGLNREAPPVVVGSHLDTVKEAGIFDGSLGVLAGLEIIKVLNEMKIETKRDVVVASFTNEEGARFQPDMMGSMVFSGELNVESAWSAVDDEGLSVWDELNRIGYLGSDKIEAGCYLELHVEQGPVLDTMGLDVGVVEGVQGMAWWDGEYEGEANHAGTTPLHLRKDALLAAAELCLELRKLAETLDRGSVATMGRLHPFPDVRNVVPGGAFFTVDFRQYEYRLFEDGQKKVASKIRETAEKHGLNYSLTQTVDARPVRFDPDMVDLVELKTRKLGLSYKRMYSGAGHDAQFMTHVCPTAMIFVPSQGGISHSPEEQTYKKDCINGANILLNCVLELATK
jgi:N-carbamoyl-L-amino-acid hydrolase